MDREVPTMGSSPKRQLELQLKGLQTLLNAHGRFVSSARNPAAAGALVRIQPLHPI